MVAAGFFVAHPAAIIFLPALCEPAQARCLGWIALLRLDVARDKPRLAVCQAPLAAVGLDQANNEEVVVVGRENVEVEAGVTVMPIQQLAVDERKHDVEARRVDNEVYR